VSQETRYYRVGLFVFAGIALLVAAVLLLGGGTFLQPTVMFETSFDESVDGLDIGSPLKIRGVTVGRVKEIQLARDLYTMPDGASLPDEHAIDVVVRVEVVSDRGRSIPSDDRHQMVSEWIRQGLRLRLTTTGITGVAYLEGDFLRPDQFPATRPPWQPRYSYIPAAPSTLRTFRSAAERVLERVEQVDVEGVLTRLNTLLTTVNSAAEKLDLESLQARAVTLLEDLHALSADVRAEFAEVNTAELTTHVAGVLHQFEATLADVRQLVRRDGGQVDSMLENVRVISQNLRDLSETLRSYPSLLLLGEPPADRSKGGKR
jgi:paraquat-inducible protein B